MLSLALSFTSIAVSGCADVHCCPAGERMPYSDVGIVRNFTKDAYNTTSAMPSLQLLEAGYTPGFDPAPPSVGSVVSPFRRVHHNLIANYNAEVTVTLDDASSRFLAYDSY